MANDRNSNQTNGNVPSRFTITPTPRRAREYLRQKSAINRENNGKPCKRILLKLVSAMGIIVILSVVTATCLWIDDKELSAFPYRYTMISLMAIGTLLIILYLKIKSDLEHLAEDNHRTSRVNAPAEVHELKAVSATLLPPSSNSECGNMILASISDEEVDLVQPAVKEHSPALPVEERLSFRRYVQSFDTDGNQPDDEELILYLAESAGVTGKREVNCECTSL